MVKIRSLGIISWVGQKDEVIEKIKFYINLIRS